MPKACQQLLQDLCFVLEDSDLAKFDESLESKKLNPTFKGLRAFQAGRSDDRTALAQFYKSFRALFRNVVSVLSDDAEKRENTRRSFAYYHQVIFRAMREYLEKEDLLLPEEMELAKLAASDSTKIEDAHTSITENTSGASSPVATPAERPAKRTRSEAQLAEADRPQRRTALFKGGTDGGGFLFSSLQSESSDDVALPAIPASVMRVQIMPQSSDFYNAPADGTGNEDFGVQSSTLRETWAPHPMLTKRLQRKGREFFGQKPVQYLNTANQYLSFAPLYDSTNATMTPQETLFLRSHLYQKHCPHDALTVPHLEAEDEMAESLESIKAVVRALQAEPLVEWKQRVNRITDENPLNESLSVSKAQSAVQGLLTLLQDMQNARFSVPDSSIQYIAQMLNAESKIAKHVLEPYFFFILSSLPHETQLATDAQLQECAHVVARFGLPSKPMNERGSEAQFKGTLGPQKLFAWASNDLGNSYVPLQVGTMPQHLLLQQMQHTFALQQQQQQHQQQQQRQQQQHQQQRQQSSKQQTPMNRNDKFPGKPPSYGKPIMHPGSRGPYKKKNRMDSADSSNSSSRK